MPYILQDCDGWGLESPFKPYTHQAQELVHHWEDVARALPWQMRSGKSMVVVVSAAALWQLGRIDAVVVISPSRVHHAWALDEFPAHCAVPFVAHSWDCSRERSAKGRRAEDLARKTLMSAKANGRLAVICINREALLLERVWKWLLRFVRRNRSLLCVDESHHYGGAKSRGTVRVRALAARCPYRRILSGTMVGNSPERVYSQFQILQEGALGYDTKVDFLRAHAVFEYDGHERKWVQDKRQWRDLGILREKMSAWGTTILRQDCEDLPPLVVSREYIELPELAREAYEVAMGEAVLHDPPLFNEARKLAMYGRDEVLRGLLPDLLREGPVVVWAPFKETVNALAEVLRRSGFRAVAHHGDLTRKKRQAAIEEAFRGNGVLVSTPDALQEGANLSAARNIVWYAPPWDVVTFDQAMERCTAVGKKAIGVTELCAKDTIETGIYQCLERKENVADWLIGKGMQEWVASSTQ